MIEEKLLEIIKELRKQSKSNNEIIEFLEKYNVPKEKIENHINYLDQKNSNNSSNLDSKNKKENTKTIDTDNKSTDSETKQDTNQTKENNQTNNANNKNTDSENKNINSKDKEDDKKIKQIISRENKKPHTKYFLIIGFIIILVFAIILFLNLDFSNNSIDSNISDQNSLDINNSIQNDMNDSNSLNNLDENIIDSNSTDNNTTNNFDSDVNLNEYTYKITGNVDPITGETLPDVTVSTTNQTSLRLSDINFNIITVPSNKEFLREQGYSETDPKMRVIGPSYQIYPQGESFEGIVNFNFCYFDEDIGDFNESNFYIAKETSGVWENIGGNPNPSNNCVDINLTSAPETSIGIYSSLE